MVTRASIESQLKALGVNVRGWGAGEIRELVRILLPHEEITGYSHGWYENGFATLVTTSERLLLIDKKFFHLTIEDVRYDMIAEVDYNASVLDATICVRSMNKDVRFTSLNSARLRALTTYVQARVMEMRQQMSSWQQFEQTPVPSPSFGFAPQTAAVAGSGSALMTNLPLPATSEQTPIRGLNSMNPYAKSGLTAKHKFLPKVPRHFRPA